VEGGEEKKKNEKKKEGSASVEEPLLLQENRGCRRGRSIDRKTAKKFLKKLKGGEMPKEKKELQKRKALCLFLTCRVKPNSVTEKVKGKRKQGMAIRTTGEKHIGLPFP